MPQINILNSIFEKFEKDDRYIKEMAEAYDTEDVRKAEERFVKSLDDEPFFNEACSAFTAALLGSSGMDKRHIMYTAVIAGAAAALMIGKAVFAKRK